MFRSMDAYDIEKSGIYFTSEKDGTGIRAIKVEVKRVYGYFEREYFDLEDKPLGYIPDRVLVVEGVIV